MKNPGEYNSKRIVFRWGHSSLTEDEFIRRNKRNELLAVAMPCKAGHD